MKKKPVVALTDEAGLILETYCIKNEKVKKLVVSKLIVKELLDRVRDNKKSTGVPISTFFEQAAEEKLNNQKNENTSVSK